MALHLSIVLALAVAGAFAVAVAEGECMPFQRGCAVGVSTRGVAVHVGREMMGSRRYPTKGPSNLSQRRRCDSYQNASHYHRLEKLVERKGNIRGRSGSS